MTSVNSTTTTTFKISGSTLRLKDLRDLVKQAEGAPDTCIVSLTHYSGDYRDPGNDSVSVTWTR